MEPLTLNEVAELLLAASYEETEALGHTNFFLNLTEIAGNLGVENFDQIVDACHLLEEKGLILLAFDHATALSATITLEGEAFVQSGGETGIIGEYRRFRAVTAAKTAGITDAPSPASNVPGQALAHDTLAPEQKEDSGAPDNRGHIIASMEMLLANTPGLSAGEKADLAVDLRTIEIQLSRNTLRKDLLEVISTDLRQVPGVAPLLDLLISLTEKD